MKKVLLYAGIFLFNISLVFSSGPYERRDCIPEYGMHGWNDGVAVDDDAAETQEKDVNQEKTSNMNGRGMERRVGGVEHNGKHLGWEKNGESGEYEVQGKEEPKSDSDTSEVPESGEIETVPTGNTGDEVVDADEVTEETEPTVVEDTSEIMETEETAEETAETKSYFPLSPYGEPKEFVPVTEEEKALTKSMLGEEAVYSKTYTTTLRVLIHDEEIDAARDSEITRTVTEYYNKDKELIGSSDKRVEAWSGQVTVQWRDKNGNPLAASYFDPKLLVY